MTLSLTSVTFLPKAYSHFGLKRKMGMKRGGLLNMRNIDQALPFHTFCLAPLFVRASKLLSAHQSSNMLNRFELDFFVYITYFSTWAEQVDKSHSTLRSIKWILLMMMHSGHWSNRRIHHPDLHTTIWNITYASWRNKDNVVAKKFYSEWVMCVSKA